MKQKESAPRQRWTKIVRADADKPVWDFKEMRQHKDLILVLVKKDLLYTFKQTALGPVWIMLNPLISTMVFALVLGYFARMQTDGVPVILFYLTGGIMWNYCANAFTNIANTLIVNSYLINKVYIPSFILPLASGITAVIKFVLTMAVSVPVIVYYLLTSKANPNAWLLAFPFLLLLIFLFTMGIGMAFSSLMVRYRDLGVLVPFITSITMFISPVLYPVSVVPEAIRICYTLNPLAGIIECFRYSITGAGSFMPYMLANATMISIITFVSGLWLFKKINARIPDYI